MPQLRLNDEIYASTVDTTGEIIVFETGESSQVAMRIRNCETSGGQLLIGVNIALGSLSATLCDEALDPGEWAEIACTPNDVVRWKASTGNIDATARRIVREGY